MALKEIKQRIQSVSSTRKITSAMKMVASAKLRKSQKQIEHLLPYENNLNSLLTNFLSAETDNLSPLAAERRVEQAALVVISSNSALCGAFNSNVIKQMNSMLGEYKNLGSENIKIYPVGKKAAKAAQKIGFEIENFDELSEKPNYDEASALAERLISDFLEKKIDKVEILFHHFQSKSRQVLTRETFLPITQGTDYKFAPANKNGKELNYIVEPSREEILNVLIPKVIKLKLYAALLDSSASEHAARMLSMQIATDNANDLLQDLTLQYNKSRQQAITSELLDITGASFGVN
ncbi:MAG: F0F1 ATP synthase subunit gamma [Prevotellaceae bacterium]|jgi:F-type H+-transporting ATPase subunit gamma|nr:F0F1 ATP synthase subunit gamma [Prevotellaceae bacterium]